MPGPSEPQGGRLRTHPGRHDAAVGRRLAALAAVDLTLAATAVLALGYQAGGIILALFVLSIAGAYAIEAAAA